MQEAPVRFLGQDDPLEKEMAVHSSILVWRIPWTEEPDRLQSMGFTRVGHDLATKPPPPVREECPYMRVETYCSNLPGGVLTIQTL